MKIAVLGATGGTGKEICKFALSKGHQVHALARTPSKMNDVQNENLKVIQGDALSVNDIVTLIKGVDVVLSALGGGSFRDSMKETTFYSDSAKNIVKAMEMENVTRLIVITSVGVEHDKGQPWFYRLLLRPLLMPTYKDMSRMETVIEESKTLEWTIVRPPYLDPSVKKSKNYQLKDKTCVKGCWKIGRIDVAKFMVDEAADGNWIGKHPTIAF